MGNQIESGKEFKEPGQELFAGEAYLRKWLLQQNLTPSEVDDLIIETHQRLKQRQ